MKKSFAAFWKRNLAFAKLAVVSNLEYRLNYFVDALLQPTFTTGVEILLWYAVFKGADAVSIAGFTREYYLSYALWSAFFARIAASWMYEFRMIEEVESGTINGILTRPMSFYEYYLSQLMGYKIVTTALSLLVPIAAAMIFDLPTDFVRLPLAILLCLYYLILVHAISFIIACCAFFLNKIRSFTLIKNMSLWILTGELFPLDLMPAGWKEVFIAMPFASGVYIPVGYITGRVDTATLIQGFYSVTAGIVALSLFGAWFWRRGLKVYAGTGA